MCYAPSRCFCSRKIRTFLLCWMSWQRNSVPCLLITFLLSSNCSCPFNDYWAKGFREGEEEEYFLFQFSSSQVFYFEHGSFLSSLQWLKLSMKRFPSLQILSSSWSLSHFMPASEGREQDAEVLSLMPSKPCSFSRGKTTGAKELEM